MSPGATLTVHQVQHGPALGQVGNGQQCRRFPASSCARRFPASGIDRKWVQLCKLS